VIVGNPKSGVRPSILAPFDWCQLGVLASTESGKTIYLASYKRRYMKTFMSVILLLAMASLSNYRNAPRAASVSGGDNSIEKVTIYYGRVSCPNNCPAYEMTIRPDRSVEYEGKEHTRVLGKRTYTISAESHRAIIDAVARAKVERLKDEYKSVPGRDEGTVILRMSWDGKTKQIVHFVPSPDVPEELTDLEKAIVENAYPREEHAPKAKSN
jgi:hypothetical protein